MRDNRISLNTLRARRPYRRLRPRAIASKFKRSGAIVDWETKTREGGRERTNRIISKMARGILFAARNARERREDEGGRGDLESIRFRFWLLHRHAKREIYVVPSLVDSSRRFFLLPSFVREKEEKKKFEKGMIIIVFFSFLPFFLFWLTMIKGGNSIWSNFVLMQFLERFYYNDC